MLKLVSLFVLLTFSAQSFSQTCVDSLRSQKRSSYFDRLSDDNQRLIAFGSSVSGLVIGLSVASAAFPAFVIAAGVASSPILVGDAIKGIQNRPINRMIKLIEQSEALVANPDSKPGRLLLRTHRKIQDHNKLISLMDLAVAISEANQSENCGGIDRVKNIEENIESGSLPMVEI